MTAVETGAPVVPAGWGGPPHQGSSLNLLLRFAGPSVSLPSSSHATQFDCAVVLVERHPESFIILLLRRYGIVDTHFVKVRIVGGALCRERARIFLKSSVAQAVADVVPASAREQEFVETARASRTAPGIRYNLFIMQI